MLTPECHQIETAAGLVLNLRRLRADDIAQVLILERAAHSHPWRPASFEACVSGRQICWLAFEGDLLVGYVVVTSGGGDAELLNLVVDQAYQQRGIGACLLKFAQDFLRPHADMLFLEVRVSNRKAIDLYAKSGFFEVGQRKNYYPSPKGHEDALLMACQLQASQYAH